MTEDCDVNIAHLGNVKYINNMDVLQNVAVQKAT